jgi:hypothetical protein
MMKVINQISYFTLTLLWTFPLLYAERSVHRPRDSQMPSIMTHWKGDTTHYHYLQSPFLDGYPFFEIFDKKYFDDHLFPKGQISFRYDPEKSIESTKMDTLIESLIKEVHEKRTSYTNFTILRDSNFNRRHQSGLLIVKSKEYPFVVKLFMETPEMFVKPYRKGFYPLFFYFMGGGINRHLSGFTRIKNAENVKKTIAQNPYWKSRVDLPRKWFWLPKDPKWITIAGGNIGKYKQTSIDVPGTYCIISDLINMERIMTLTNPEDRIESMALCNIVKFCIDPHIDNFAIEKGTRKIVIVDTEDMRSIVGLKKDVGPYTSQTAWYCDLSSKAIDDIFFRDKSKWHAW